MLDQKIALVFKGIVRRNHDPRQPEPCWPSLDIELSSSKWTGHSKSCPRESVVSILSSINIPRFHPVEPKTIQQDLTRRMSLFNFYGGSTGYFSTKNSSGTSGWTNVSMPGFEFLCVARNESLINTFCSSANVSDRTKLGRSDCSKTYSRFIYIFFTVQSD